MDGALENLGPGILFCPGDRPERFAKAVASADLAILDIEDGVGASAKEAARSAVADFIAGGGRAGVRINRPLTGLGAGDLAAVARAGAKVILLPKTEGPGELDAVAALSGAVLIASIETARGVLAAEAIAAHPAVGAISWGPYDLAADMGLRTVRDPGGALLGPLAHVRDRLIVAAAAAGKRAIDTVTAELRDPERIEADAAEAADLGFLGKFAIHPAQIPIIRAAFAPTAAAVERSRRMLAAIGEAGVMLFEGEMVDEPMLRRARAVLRAAEAAKSAPAP